MRGPASRPVLAIAAAELPKSVFRTKR